MIEVLLELKMKIGGDDETERELLDYLGFHRMEISIIDRAMHNMVADAPSNEKREKDDIEKESVIYKRYTINRQLILEDWKVDENYCYNNDEEDFEDDLFEKCQELYDTLGFKVFTEKYCTKG